MNQSYPVWYVERLTAWVLFVQLLPRLYACTPKPKAIFYIDAHPDMARLAVGLLKRLGVECQCLEFRMADVCDAQGYLMPIRFAFQDGVEVLDDILKNTFLKDALEQCPEDFSALRMYLTKGAIPFNWFERDFLMRGMYLVQVVHWHAKQKGRTGSSTVLFVPHNTWRGPLDRYGLKYGVQVEVLASNNHAFSRLTKERIRFSLGLWRRLQRRLQHRRLKPLHDPYDNRPKITVDYYGHLNLDNPGLHTDVFFKQGPWLRDEALLLAFKIPKDPLDQAKLESLNRQGVSAIVTNPLASDVVDEFWHWPRRQAADAKLDGVLRNMKAAAPHGWIKAQSDTFAMQVNYWQDLFLKTNTKMYVMWYKYDQSHAIQTQAMRQAKGVMVMYQRAFEEFASPKFAVCADVFFAFSKLSADVARGNGSSIPYMVITGYGGDYRFNHLKPMAAQIRQQLQAQGAKKILAFFDEGSSADARWQTGHEFMRTQYQFLFEKVLQYPWLGLVIKPKVSQSLRQRLGPVAQLLKEAQATGRCALIQSDTATLHESYPPALAALAADVALQGCMAAGTAGLEAALTGTPTLMFDAEGCPNSCLYQLGPATVFRRLDDMWKTCQQHWQTPGGVPGFGDWSGMINDFDPFRDGLAAERTGMYMQWMMDGFKAGLSKEDVLARAAEQYAKRWGKDKIIRING